MDRPSLNRPFIGRDDLLRAARHSPHCSAPVPVAGSVVLIYGGARRWVSRRAAGSVTGATGRAHRLISRRAGLAGS